MIKIDDPEVARVLRETPRRRFIPEDLQSQAGGDYPLPIGFGATISQPSMVGLMTQLLRLSPAARVLEIGTGSGFQAAVLAQLAGSVYSLEIVPELARRARQTLHELGYHNVVVIEGDGHAGLPQHAPYDAILLTAAPARIPRALFDQLASPGILVAPVGEAPRQELVVVEKDAGGQLRRRRVTPVSFVPMKSRA